MSLSRNPFAKSKTRPGEGEIVLALLPPGKQVLTSCEYQYPLKLISPDPHIVTIKKSDENANGQINPDTTTIPITTIFLLTYGGGLLASDSINLTITLEPHTRLALLTQGSTKIFKSKTSSTNPATTTTQSPELPTSQTLNVKISPHSTLCYLPDPNQPYAESIYEQRQTFYIDPSGSSSLLLLDWVSEGRSARGEHWTLTSWKGRNEVREFDQTSKGRLLIRDALLLFGDNLSVKTDGKGILGTLIIYGPVWKHLAEFFMREFRAQPRIGAKNWTSTVASQPKTPIIMEAQEEDGGYFDVKKTNANSNMTPQTSASVKQKKQQAGAAEAEGLLWTAAQVRGFVLVKFGAKDIDGARRWLGEMLKRDGSVEREFGHQALLCLR